MKIHARIKKRNKLYERIIGSRRRRRRYGRESNRACVCFVVDNSSLQGEEEVQYSIVIELDWRGVKGSQISAHQITTLTTDAHTHTTGGLQKVVVLYCCCLLSFS